MKSWKTALSGSSSTPSSSKNAPGKSLSASNSARPSLSSESTGTSLLTSGPGSQQSLRFHSRHGDNIQLSPDFSEARRVRSYCKGIVFSDRPIDKTEMVCFRITDQTGRTRPSQSQWSGSLRIGITTQNPDTVDLSRALYLCPDLTSRPGFWARPLPDSICPLGAASDDVIHFQCLPDNQTITYGINGQTKGVAFEKVDTTQPIWAVFDVYGSTLAVQLLDSSIFLRPPNQTRSQSNISPLSVLMALKNRHSSLTSTPNIAPPPSVPTSARTSQFSSPVTTPSETRNFPLSVTNSLDSAPPANVRHRPRHFTHLPLRSLSFHKDLTGRNVVLSDENRCARLLPGEFCSGYVFTPRPVLINETVVVRIVENDWDFDGGVALGLTTCDPMTICQASLPDDSDQLLDRGEYWVVAKDVASKPKEGQELAVTVRSSGTVQISRNNGKPSDFLFVDPEQKFWLFFDLYGTTRKLLLLGSCITAPVAGTSASSASTFPKAETTPSPRKEEPRRPIPPPSSARTASLTVALPSSPRPSVAPPVPVARQMSLSLNHPQTNPNIQRRNRPTSSDLIDLSVDLPLAVQLPGPPPPLRPAPPAPQQAVFPTIPGKVTERFVPQSECVICFEEAALAVLYTCGHQVMCYKCAQGQFKRNKPCPICQQPIKDVIKTFRG